MPDNDDDLRELARRTLSFLDNRVVASEPPDIATELLTRAVPRVPYPPCLEVLLSLIPADPRDFVRQDFDDYFAYEAPGPVDNSDIALAGLNPELVAILRRTKQNWLPECCSCTPLVTLKGRRNLPPPVQGPDPVPIDHLRRLFAGDVVWLFYYERLGIFKILGALLDDYAVRGRFPISSGAALRTTSVTDDNVAQVLEIMVRQLKSGEASPVRDRDATYRRVPGWTSDVGRQVGSAAAVNKEVDRLLNQAIRDMLAYYRDRRLARAIQGTLGAPAASTATVTAIADTLRVLKQHLEPFDYGRNYYNTLNGIAWAIAGMSVVRELRSALGIPTAYDDPHEYIPAAYNLLVVGGGAGVPDPNRFTVHRTCARNGRDLLLDIDGLPDSALEAAAEGGPLDAWLQLVEAKVEGYRTAYQTLTGRDLGKETASEQAA